MPRIALRASAVLIAIAVFAPTAAAQERAQTTTSSASTRSSGDLTTGTIKAAQRKLRVTADGRLGPQTRRAIRRFQRRRGLRVNGRLTTATLQALGVTPRTKRRPTSTSSTTLERIAQCESGGNPRAVSPDGKYRGKYQFSLETWESVGGTGDPIDASEAEQDRLAAVLYERQGPSAWPNCA